MFGLFKAKCPLSAEEWEWHLACLQWLGDQFPDIGGAKALQVQPSAAYFSPISGHPHDVASDLLDQTKSLIGMAAWPSYLVSGEETRAPMIAGNAIQQFHTHAPGGTFRLMMDEQEALIAEITYNPAEAARHEKLAAIFAHEMSHFLLESADRSPPGGEDCLELLTDYTAIWLGFGILLANSAKSVGTQDVGQGQIWQMQWSGYLSERAIIMAFAAIERLAGRDSMEAAPFLKSHLATDLKAANKFLDTIDLEAEIAAIDLEEFQVEPREKLLNRLPINPPAALSA